MTDLHLHKLLICRSLLDDPVIGLLSASQNEPQNTSLPFECAAMLLKKAEELSLSGNLLKAYLVYLLTDRENLAASTIEFSRGHIGMNLQQIFLHDIKILRPFFQKPLSYFLPVDLLDDYQPTKKHVPEPRQALEAAIGPDSSPEAIAEAFISYYRQYGYGDLAACRAFCWSKEKSLQGIKHFDVITLQDIIGYEKQKKQLVDNTAAFLADKPANNVLLVGARGTGKSSAVKALANQYFSQGLRLLQLTKQQLIDLPLIMQKLRCFTSKKFIVFLDDLSFEGFETEYKHLKSTIEGGVESRPGNVLIYATSNRRHLIKETWRDREDGQDELYKNDSINETISLSDRFGLIINYRMPDQNEYLAIIDHYLRKDGIALDKETLRVLGHRWEIEHSGRTGRTARQFVDYYLGQNK